MPRKVCETERTRKSPSVSARPSHSGHWREGERGRGGEEGREGERARESERITPIHACACDDLACVRARECTCLCTREHNSDRSLRTLSSAIKHYYILHLPLRCARKHTHRRQRAVTGTDNARNFWACVYLCALAQTPRCDFMHESAPNEQICACMEHREHDG